MKKYYRLDDSDDESSQKKKEGSQTITDEFKSISIANGKEDSSLDENDVTNNVSSDDEQRQQDTNEIESDIENENDNTEELLMSMARRDDREDILDLNHIPSIPDSELTKKLALVNLDWDHIKVIYPPLYIIK